MSAKIKALVDKSFKIHGELEGKVGAAFASSGGTASGAETTLLSILEAMLVHGMIIQVSPKLHQISQTKLEICEFQPYRFKCQNFFDPQNTP